MTNARKVLGQKSHIAEKVRRQRTRAKAILAGVGAGTSYLIGVLVAIGDGASFSDISLVGWLGLIPVVLGIYGITWRVPNAG